MEKDRFLNCDLIRTIAIYFVVIIHSLGCVETGTVGVLNEENITNAVLSFVKCAVPLFVMLSGSLLLNKQESISVFYKKRLIRLIPPFLIWSFIIYSLYFIKNGNDFFIASFFLNYIKQTITLGVVPVYWYIYMIVGLYIITPFLRKLFQTLNRSESIYFICLLFMFYVISLLFPNFETTTRFLFDNLIYLFYYCFGFVYVIYLKDFKLPLWGIVLLISYILNVFNLLYDFTDFPFVVLYSISIFVLLYRLNLSNKFILRLHWLVKFVRFSSKVSYGIYLFHIAIISAIISLGVFNGYPVFLMPVAIGTAALIISLLLCVFIKKIKWLI